MRYGVGKLSQAQWWRLRWVGFGLFVISFFVPSRLDNLEFFSGAIIFVQAPVFAFDFLVGEKNVLAAVVVFASWLANLSVAVPRRKWVALAAILAVWTVYGCFFAELLRFVPFYPWAVGISVVQIANLLRDEQSVAPDVPVRISDLEK